MGPLPSVRVEGNIEANMKGCTLHYASPNMRSIFAEAKAKPMAERAAVLDEHTVTQADDAWCLAATVFSMFAEYGWTEGQMDVSEHKSLCLRTWVKEFCMWSEALSSRGHNLKIRRSSRNRGEPIGNPDF